MFKPHKKRSNIRGILSPKLFNIFYNTLIVKLEKLGIFVMDYADDIVIAITGMMGIKRAINAI